jgi:hypothetical protein
VCVTGGWGETGLKTETCHSSEPTPKNAPSPSRPVHAVLGLSAFCNLLTNGFSPKNANQMKNSAKPTLMQNALAELLGEPNEKSFGSADVSEPIRVLVLDHFADKLRAALE